MSRRVVTAGLTEGLDALTAQVAYDHWVRSRQALTGYPDGPMSDRSPLAAVLYTDIRRGYRAGGISDLHQAIFEWSLKYEISSVDLVRMFPREPVKRGRRWELEELTPRRVREIIRCVRGWVLRKDDLGVLTVTVEAVGWDGVGEILYG